MNSLDLEDHNINPVALAIAKALEMSLREVALGMIAVGTRGAADRVEVALAFGANLRERSDEFCFEVLRAGEEFRVWEGSGKTKEEWMRNILMNGVIQEQIESYKRTNKRRLAAERVCEEEWGSGWVERFGDLL